MMYRQFRLRLLPLLVFGFVCSVFIISSPAHSAERTLRILTWEGLADNTWVKPFEKKHNVEILRTYVGSNDEYMAKLAAGNTQYDMVVIVSSLAQPAIKAGFVEPLNLEKIPNFDNVYPPFQKLDFLQKDSKQYGVPNDWDILPVTVNADVVDGCAYDVLFDPRYKGRIAMWDDVATLGTVAANMGFDDVWSLSDEELAKVKQKLLEQKPLIRTYWSTGGEITQLFATGEVVASLSWSYVTEQLQEQGMNVRQCAPERPTAFLDANFIVAGTNHRDLVHKFLNYLVSAKVQAQVYKSSGFGVVNAKVKQHLPEDVFEDSLMSRSDEFRQDISFWEEIPNRGEYLQVWNEIKATPVQ